VGSKEANVDKKRRLAAGLLTGTMLLAVVVVLLLSVATAAAEPGPTSVSYDLYWDVIGNGGTSMSSSSYIMDSTTGQSVTGESSSTSYTLRSGYWQDFFYKTLLPIIMKLFPTP
jgi:hypothetical protein